MTTPIKLLRSNVPGRAPDEEALAPRGLAINIPDRAIFYRDKDGKVASWSAAEMPDELWDRFANGFDMRGT